MADTPQFHSGWSVSIPDTGAQYIAAAGDSIAKTISSAGKSLDDNLKQSSATDGLLKTFGAMKDPTTGNPLIDPETMASIGKQSVPAKQQFIGMLSANTAQQMQQSAELQGQKNLLGYFQQNPNAMNTKMNIATAANPGNRIAQPQISQNAQPTTTPPAVVTPAPAPATPQTTVIPTPANAAIHGYYNTQETYKGSDVHVLRGPDGKIQSVVNLDGTPARF